jgi:SAM-dependent methyltransferase
MSGATSTNRDYYEAASAARDDYWRFMAAPRARVARILDLVRLAAPASLLDLGCGNGQLLDEIARAFPAMKLAGLDLAARQLAENGARAPRIEWLQGDLSQPVAAPATFECITASEVIEHLDDPRALLANAHRLAGPGAHLIVSTQSGTVRETERRVGHVRHFTADDMTALLEAEGWTPLRVWNEGFPFHDLSKWWANRNPDASMARFGGAHRYGTAERALCFALRTAFRLNSRRRGAQLYALARKRA